MTNPTEPAVNGRIQTANLLAQMETMASEYALPAPPPSLAEYQEKLLENQYDVLVVGEAKRGKSSFINALIGQDILPTDVDIATSQVFHISPADRPSYKIRFEDESTQDITVADLNSYGSQVVIDEQDIPKLNQIIRWIEVTAPVQFLPEGMSILDTPGLGSLYSEHSQITQRFVPFADAVIYVLDSTQPLGQPDKEFIENILGFTSDIFFIQTRIDQFRRNEWQAVQERNQELLAEIFGDRLADTSVWPVSSTNLLKAVETGDDDYLQISRSQELLDALQGFLFRVAGSSRVQEALEAARRYHATGANVLDAHLSSIDDPSHENKQQLLKLSEKRHKQFEDSWGISGVKRLTLKSEFEKVIFEGKERIDAALRPDGEIEREQLRRIDRLKAQKEFQSYGERLRDEVLESVISRWKIIIEESQEKVGELFNPFLATVEFMNLPIEVSQPHYSHQFSLADDTSFQNLSSMMLVGAVAFERLPAEQIAAVGGSIFSKIIADPKVLDTILSPLANIIDATIFPFVGAAFKAVSVVAISALIGWTLKRWQRGSHRDKLQEYLSDILIEIRRYFFDVDPVTGKSIIDRQFDRFLQTTQEYVQTISAQKLSEAQVEINRLKEDAQLDAVQRQTKAETLRQKFQQWSQLETSMNKISQDLNDSKLSLSM